MLMNDLRNHQNEDVAKLAKGLRDKWKKFFRDDKEDSQKPLQEVRVDICLYSEIQEDLSVKRLKIQIDIESGFDSFFE